MSHYTETSFVFCQYIAIKWLLNISSGVRKHHQITCTCSKHRKQVRIGVLYYYRHHNKNSCLLYSSLTSNPNIKVLYCTYYVQSYVTNKCSQV